MTATREKQPLLGATGYRLAGWARQKGRNALARGWHYMNGHPDLPFDDAVTPYGNGKRADARIQAEIERHAPIVTPAALDDPFALPRAIAQVFGAPPQDPILLRLVEHIAPFRLTALPDPAQARVDIDAAGLPVILTRTRVHTEKQGLSVEDARKLALLALACPRMREEGVTVDGSPADRYLLAEAASSLGLKVLNPPEDLSPEDQKIVDDTWFDYVRHLPENKNVRPLTPEMRDFLREALTEGGLPPEELTDEALDRRWIGMGAQNREGTEQALARKKSQKEQPEDKPSEKSDMEKIAEQIREIMAGADSNKSGPTSLVSEHKRAVAGNVAAILEKAKIDEETYARARTLVIEQKKATLTLLRTELGVSQKKAHALMDALVADGVVKRVTESVVAPRTRRSHEVISAPQPQ